MGNVLWRVEAYGNCLDYDLEDTGTWSDYDEMEVNYGRSPSGTVVDAKERVYGKWEALYHDAIAECRDFGLRVYCWDTLLGDAVGELSRQQAAGLAWAFQHLEPFEVGDAYPLVALHPDGRTASVCKMTRNLSVISRSFLWDGQTWVAQSEHGQ